VTGRQRSIYFLDVFLRGEGAEARFILLFFVCLYSPCSEKEMYDYITFFFLLLFLGCIMMKSNLINGSIDG